MFISSGLFNKISWNKYQVRIFHTSSIISNTFILYLIYYRALLADNFKKYKKNILRIIMLFCKLSMSYSIKQDTNYNHGDIGLLPPYFRVIVKPNRVEISIL